MILIYKLFNIIRFIYRTDIVFFILLFVLLSISDVYFNLVNKHFDRCFYNILSEYVFSSLICIILSFVNKYNYLRKTLNVIIIFFFTTYLVINTYSINLTLTPFDHSVIELFLSTNYNEIIEFIKSYISIYNILLLFIVFVGLILLTSRKYFLKKSSIVNILSVIFILNTFICIFSPYLHETPIGRLYMIYKYRERIEITPDLTLYQKNPDLLPTRDVHPENIVIVIGESFAKTHSSLYGYPKKTNPLLETHHKENNLYIYDNVVAPASHTEEVFKTIMSSFSYERSNKDWYKSTTIPECFKKIGYETVWISNQSKYGAFDNLPTRYSQLCDTAIFTKKNISDKYNDQQILNKIVEKPFKKELFILHLMGQHFKYSERYPDEYHCFIENDYLDLKPHQRRYVSEYDNATLFNDFVVDSMINLFSEKETVLLYFSDHGQDIYYSNENYCGHGITANAKSDSIGRDIPFMIYTSPSFKENYPDLINKIQGSTNRAYNTENLIFTLLDIAGYKFKENNDVEKYSLLSIE